MVFAVDVNRGRLRILKETAKLHQVDGVVTTIHADLRTLTVCYISFLSYVVLNSTIVYFLSVFCVSKDGEPLKSNKVLLDAPCSGLGVLSKVVVLNILCLDIVIVFTLLFNVFLFSCLLIYSYHLAFEESGLTLEQEAGGYRTIENITG